MTGETRKTRRLTAAFFFFTLILFAQCAMFGFIGLDDAGYTFRNPFVATGLSVANVIESFTNFRNGGIWMPITYIGYMLDIEVSRLLGMSLSAWMHSVNVVLHSLNGVMLVFLAGTLASATYVRGKPGVIVLAVAFWAFHPMRAEPVAWIACRKELLWVLFTLCGLVAWVKALLSRSGLSAGLALFFCAAACLSKPTAMCFPFLAGSIHLLMRFGGARDSVLAKLTSRELVAYALMLGMAGATAFAAAYSQTHVAGQEAVELFAAPLALRIVNALSALGFYLRATVWPSALHVDCRIVEGALPLGWKGNFAALAAALGVCAFVFFKIKAWRCSPAAAVFWFSFIWFMLPLVPTLGVLGSFGIEAHADRFTYLPAMAAVFAAALFPIGESSSANIASSRIRMAAWVLVAVYAALAFRQTRFWRDDHTAHMRALVCDPLHPRAMVHVGDALCARYRDFDGGIKLYRRSMELRPREYVKYRLAYALASRGNWDDYLEVKKIGAAVAAKPSLDQRGMMLDALGTAYMADGNWKKAAEMFKASISAPGRFWPKASTERKLRECLERMD